jgi:radical SAM protein with 4Fe4S-binding SPASM domain
LAHLATQAGFEAVEVENVTTRPARPTLRLTARRSDDTPGTRFAARLHRAFITSGILRPLDAPQYLSALETICEQASPKSPISNLPSPIELVSLSARYSPRVAACVLGCWPDASAWPAAELAQARQLVADLEREQFPARLACRWRTLPKLPGATDAAWTLLEREISLYLAARLCPDEGLDDVRDAFDTATADLSPSDLAVDFFCREALTGLARRLTARGVRAFARGNLEDGAMAFEAALGHDPDLLWPRWNLARLHLCQNRRLDALVQYEQLQAHLPAGLRTVFEREMDAVTGRSGELDGFTVPLADPADLLRKMWSLECCVWELTLRCNLRCAHCGATAGRPRPDELTTAEALRVAGELAALPTHEVTLMGGELFLRDDWLAVAERLRSRHVQLVIFTNATLITHERIAQLRALEPRTIGTSLDGGCAAVHDGIRGVSGAFDKTLAAIDDLQAAGLRVSVITTLTRRNLYELPDIVRLLAGRDIRWQIQVASAGGERLARSDLLTPLEFYVAALFITRMRATYPWSALPVIGAHDFGYCSTYLPSLRVPGQVWAGCSAGRDVLGIRSDGGLKGCLSLPDEFVVGSLRERRLSELWEGDTFASLRQPATRYGLCADCPHGEGCEGGCTSLAVTYSGRRGENPMCLYHIEREWNSLR